MDFKIEEDREIKCEIPIKTEVLDCEFYESNNIDQGTNLDLKYEESAEEGICVKEENDEFEEELHVIEDTCIKSENSIDNSGLVEEKPKDHPLSQNSTLQQDTGRKRDQCHICKKSYVHLKRHLLSHTRGREKNYKCDICKKSFALEKYLKSHMLTFHLVYNNFKCTICDEKFLKKSQYIHHLSLCNGIKNFKCDICQQSFARIGNLQTHLLDHTNENNFECTICYKSFSKPQSLNGHLLLHRAKNYKCKMCEKSFTQNSSLKRHMWVHAEKNFKCAVCDKSFYHVETLHEHLRKKNCKLEEQQLNKHHIEEHLTICVKEEINYEDEIKNEVLDSESDEQNNADKRQEIKYEDGIKMEVLDYESDEQDNADEQQEIKYEDGIKMEVLDYESDEQDNADEQQEIKYEDGIKMEVLDSASHEQDNANFNENSNVYYQKTQKSVKEENDKFEEKLQDIEVTNIT